MRVRLGAPHGRVDAVEHAHEAVAGLPKGVHEAMRDAVVGRQFARVRRADRRHDVGPLNREAHRVDLAADECALNVQPEAIPERLGHLALVVGAVDRERARQPPHGGVHGARTLHRRDQRGVVVVQVQHVHGWRGARPEPVQDGELEDDEPGRAVRKRQPIGRLEVDARVAEMRRLVDKVDRHAERASGAREAVRAPHAVAQALVAERDVAVRDERERAGLLRDRPVRAAVERHHDARLGAFLHERGRERPDDVAQPADLGERRALGGDVKDSERRGHGGGRRTENCFFPPTLSS